MGDRAEKRGSMERGGFKRGRGEFKSRGGRGGRGSSQDGSRGAFRSGSRDGFRGDSRGGFRGGSRGGFRGGSRGGFRGGSRGGARGSFRGGSRGGSRGGFRGSRGSSNFRGRGGPRGDWSNGSFAKQEDKPNGDESGGEQNETNNDGTADGVSKGRGGSKGQDSQRRNSRGGDSRGRGAFRGRGEHGTGSQNINALSESDHSKDENRKRKHDSSERNGQNINAKADSRPQDLKRKLKLTPEETKKAILITNLPKKVESLHKELQNFVNLHVGPVKLITYNKFTYTKSACISAICVFEDPSDMKLAINKLHGQEFQGHHLLVQQFKNAKHNTHHTSKHCICVENIPLNASEEDLWKLFESCGQLGMIHVNRNSLSGEPLEALVNFNDQDSIENALKLNGAQILDSSIKVAHLDRRYSILVTNLDRQTKHQDFKDFLEDYNVVYFTFGPKRKREQKTAFVFLSDKASLKKALELNGQDFKGSTISVSCTGQSLSVDAYDIYMPLLPRETTAGEITKCLLKYGKVTNVVHPYKKNVTKVGFETEEQAKAALEASKIVIYGKEIDICHSFSKALRIKKAIMKAEEDNKKQSSEPLGKKRSVSTEDDAKAAPALKKKKVKLEANLEGVKDKKKIEKKEKVKVKIEIEEEPEEFKLEGTTCKAEPLSSGDEDNIEEDNENGLGESSDEEGGEEESADSEENGDEDSADGEQDEDEDSEVESKPPPAKKAKAQAVRPFTAMKRKQMNPMNGSAKVTGKRRVRK